MTLLESPSGTGPRRVSSKQKPINDADGDNVKYLGIQGANKHRDFLMIYDSPKTLRRRQNQAENKTARPRRQRKVSLASEWDTACDFHIQQIQANSDWADAAGRHARALVTMARQRGLLEVAQ